MDIQLQRINEAMIRAALFEFAVGIIVLIIMFWLTYAVFKAAIRDGIKESGLSERMSTKQTAPPGYKWTLVKEFVDTKPMHVD